MNHPEDAVNIFSPPSGQTSNTQAACLGFKTKPVMSHNYRQIGVTAELIWLTITPFHADKGDTCEARLLFASSQSWQICLACIRVTVGIGTYNELLLGRPGACRQADQWIRVMQSLCAAAGLLWFHHKDTSEQQKGQEKVRNKGEINHWLLFYSGCQLATFAVWNMTQTCIIKDSPNWSVMLSLALLQEAKCSAD